jgi:hypothetical protein
LTIIQEPLAIIIGLAVIVFVFTQNARYGRLRRKMKEIEDRFWKQT